MITPLLCAIALYIALFVGRNHQPPWKLVSVYWGLVALNYLTKKGSKKHE